MQWKGVMPAITTETLIAPPHVQVLAAQLRASLKQAQADSD
ncbi:hypothetical protein [Microcoleus sp. B9-D4]